MEGTALDPRALARCARARGKGLGGDRSGLDALRLWAESARIVKSAHDKESG